jgi:hypothetical protein
MKPIRTFDVARAVRPYRPSPLTYARRAPAPQSPRWLLGRDGPSESQACAKVTQGCFEAAAGDQILGS